MEEDALPNMPNIYSYSDIQQKIWLYYHSPSVGYWVNTAMIQKICPLNIHQIYRMLSFSAGQYIRIQVSVYPRKCGSTPGYFLRDFEFLIYAKWYLPGKVITQQNMPDYPKTGKFKNQSEQ